MSPARVKTLMLGLIGLCLLFIAAMELYQIANTRSPVGDEPALENALAQQQVSDGQVTHYYAREYEGNIGIFLSKDDTEPIQVLRTLVVTLPPYDIELLSRGIEIVGDQALASFIEDYTS